jgi:hypothetical protein
VESSQQEETQQGRKKRRRETVPMAMTQTVHADEDDKHRAGQLHKLRLENFMCHENFEMTFG